MDLAIMRVVFESESFAFDTGSPTLSLGLPDEG